MVGRHTINEAFFPSPLDNKQRTRNYSNPFGIICVSPLTLNVRLKKNIRAYALVVFDATKKDCFMQSLITLYGTKTSVNSVGS